MNKGIEMALKQGCIDLARFMDENPNYSDIKSIRIEKTAKNTALMVVVFENGYLEHREWRFENWKESSK